MDLFGQILQLGMPSHLISQHLLVPYHTNHHSRISHIVSSALIASNPASVLSGYSFLLAALAHRLVRGT